MADPRILCFGDSLTEGYTNYGIHFAPYSESTKGKLVASGIKAQIVTEGQSGDLVTRGFMERMEARYKANTTRKPIYDWVVILGGTNDLGWGRSAEEVYKALVDLSLIPLEDGSKLLMLTVPECGVKNKSLDKRRNELNNLIKSDERDDVYFLDLHAKIPYHSMEETEREEIWDDGLHFTPKGYERMGGFVAERLIEIISELDKKAKVD